MNNNMLIVNNNMLAINSGAVVVIFEYNVA